MRCFQSLSSSHMRSPEVPTSRTRQCRIPADNILKNVSLPAVTAGLPYWFVNNIGNTEFSQIAFSRAFGLITSRRAHKLE